MEVIIVPPDIDSSPGFDVWRYLKVTLGLNAT